MGRSPSTAQRSTDMATMRSLYRFLILILISTAVASGWYWLGSRVDGIPIPFTHEWLASRIGTGQEDHDSLLFF